MTVLRRANTLDFFMSKGPYWRLRSECAIAVMAKAAGPDGVRGGDSQYRFLTRCCRQRTVRRSACRRERLDGLCSGRVRFLALSPTATAWTLTTVSAFYVYPGATVPGYGTRFTIVTLAMLPALAYDLFSGGRKALHPVGETS